MPAPVAFLFGVMVGCLLGAFIPDIKASLIRRRRRSRILSQNKVDLEA